MPLQCEDNAHLPERSPVLRYWQTLPSADGQTHRQQQRPEYWKCRQSVRPLSALFVCGLLFLHHNSAPQMHLMLPRNHLRYSRREIRSALQHAVSRLRRLQIRRSCGSVPWRSYSTDCSEVPSGSRFCRWNDSICVDWGRIALHALKYFFRFSEEKYGSSSPT